MAFSLSLLGTFLVRSGIITSVHSFASDPARGLFILIFMLLVVGGSLLLYALRAPKLVNEVHFGAFSKETAILMNNILLVVTMAMVLFGTLYPLLVDALSGNKISVGPPYFNSMFIPLTVPLAVIVGIGAMSRWKRDELSRFRPMMIGFLASSLLVSASITQYLSTDGFSFGGFAGLALALWVLSWSVYGIVERLQYQSDWLNGLRTIPASIWGMTSAHIGIAIFIIGVTHVNAYSVEKDIRMNPGESFQLGRYNFTFEGVSRVEQANFVANEGSFIVDIDGEQLVTLKPQKRFYSSGNPMTEAAINTTLARDLYVSLGEELEQGAWSVRLYLKSFVACIWLGGLFMALGGLIATTDRRYRRPRKKVNQSQTAATGSH